MKKLNFRSDTLIKFLQLDTRYEKKKEALEFGKSDLRDKIKPQSGVKY